MRFSIIVPVYNVAEYLQRCIQSILANDCSDCELLLVDDGSTDGQSGPMCDGFAAAHPDFIQVIHKTNGGLGDARNAGLERANGEYVIFIDSDDYIAPDYLATISAAVNRTPADVYTFDFFLDSGKKTEVFPDSQALPEGSVFTLAQQPGLLLQQPNAWSRVWKRALFLSTGIRYPARVWYEDIRTSGKLFAQASGIVAIHKPLYYYYIRDNSITRNRNLEKNLEILDAMEDLLGYFQSNGLFDAYQKELCQLAIDHVLIAATVRVARIDPTSALLAQLRDEVTCWFPDYKRCPYIRQLPPAKRLALGLSEHRLYRVLHLLFRLKDGR